MGLLSFFKRWSKAEDDRALERAEGETRMTPLERDIGREDYEGRKDDSYIAGSFAGAEATEAFENSERDER
ncbi:MAG TPA: hypothetical protein VFW85_01210 [Gaiellaceae bacterium]|nr:hypothetical protein [Gaiellaceae bacterium]